MFGSGRSGADRKNKTRGTEMKLVKTLLQVTAIVALLSVAPIFAQTTANIRVDVPFAFQVGDQKLPAGEYTMKAAGGSQVMLIQNTDGKSVAMTITWPNPSITGPDTAQVRFRVYGEAHYLAGVWIPGSEGRFLQKSRAEGKSAESKSPLEVAVLRMNDR